MALLRYAVALGLLASVGAPARSRAQEPWIVTTTTTSPLPIGSCSAIQVEIREAITREVPRNASGDRVTVADFDVTIMSDGGAVSVQWLDGYHPRACVCQGGSVGAAAAVTATYPSALLAQGYRVPGVSLKSTGDFTIGRREGTFQPPSCTGSAQRPPITRSALPASSTTLATKSATKPIALKPAPVTRVPVAPAPVSPTGTTTATTPTTTSTPLLLPSSPIFPPTTTGAPTDAIAIAPGGIRAMQGAGPTGFKLVPNVPIIASLVWDDMPNAVSYSLRRGVGANAPVERLRRTASEEKGARDTIPDPRDTYLYSLFVTYADGSFNTSPTVSFVSPPLKNPPGFTATHAGEGNVVFGWQPVPGAKSYRLDGPGFPATGLSVTDATSGTYATPSGANSWKLTTLYQGNFADYANPSTASAVVRVLPPHLQPWLTKNNGAGSQENVQMPRQRPVECLLGGLGGCVYPSVLPNQLQYPYDVNYATFLGKTEGDLGTLGLFGWLDLYPFSKLWTDPLQFAVEAVYGNPGDLGFGRRSDCFQRTRTGLLPGVYTVCYAAAHGFPPGDPRFNEPGVITAPKEGEKEGYILAMVIAKEPTGTTFLVFLPTVKVFDPVAGTVSGAYKLAQTVSLDTEGPKYVPFACLSCHGGKYNATTHKVDDASFLPIVPDLQSFATEAAKSEQQEKIRRINAMIVKSGSAPALVAYINDLYNNQVSLPGRRAISDFVPSGWQTQSELYKSVVRPYCATCHLAAPAQWNFASWANFAENKDLIKAAVCKAHTMPHAELQYNAFWTKDTGPVYLPQLLATTLNWDGNTPGAKPTCP